MKRTDTFPCQTSLTMFGKVEPDIVLRSQWGKEVNIALSGSAGIEEMCEGG